MKLSSQQQDIIAAVARNDHDIQVVARAGTGKTTTAVLALKEMRGTVGFFAFNKEIAEELKRKAPSTVDVRTFHSLGFAAIRNAYGNSIKLEDDKTFDLLMKCGIAHGRDPLMQPCKKLVSLCKNLLCETDDDALAQVCLDYDIDMPESRGFSIVRNVLKRSLPGNRVLGTEGATTIDFDDMVWWPAKLGLPMPAYDWVVIDEAQDTNPVQVALVEAISRTGRLMFIGDPRQAIYAFRGANENAMPELASFLEGLGREVKTYPLTITRRCPQSVVRLAQYYVPDIEAAPEAPEGTVEAVDKVIATVGDMVLCRANAPLIQIAYGFIRMGLPVVIRGRDIGAGLKSLVEKLKPSDLTDLGRRLDIYLDAQVRLAEARFASKPWKAQAAIAAAEDKVATLHFLIEQQASVDGLLDFITRLFSDSADMKKVILLSSIHKAKGLESGTVWLQEFKELPGAQESNIMYVAITRAKNRLFIVPVPGQEVRIPIGLAQGVPA